MTLDRTGLGPRWARAPLPTRSIASFLAGLALAGCAAAGAVASTGLLGLDILRKTFDGAAAKNYGEAYKDNADDLFRVIAKPAQDEVSKAGKERAPAAPAAGATAAPAAVTVASNPSPAPATTQGSAEPQPASLPISPASTTSPAPLALEVGLFKEAIVDGRSMPVPVQDGETLYDGFGSHGSGDAIKFMFRATADAFVYVISIDGTGWIQPIFPSNYSGSTNPVKANQTYLFPEGSTWAPLDSYRGVEHIYFMASRSPRPDLEKTLAAFSARVREADPSRAGGERSTALAQVATDAPLMRGFGAPRKSVHEVPISEGRPVAVESQLFVSNSPGDILVTRWFRHE